MPKVGLKVNIGDVKGRLTIVGFIRQKKHRTKVTCSCVCGNIKDIPLDSWNWGNCNSCGCLRKEKIRQLAVSNRKYGCLPEDRQTKIYKVWKQMRRRCLQTKDKDFHNYGGRGITICDRWLTSFPAFREDMGNPPEKHTIDRINVNGNYSPDNCRWALQKTQSRNTRKNKKVLYCGSLICITELIEKTKTNLAYNTILRRIFDRKWTVEDAVNIPRTDRTYLNGQPNYKKKNTYLREKELC